MKKSTKNTLEWLFLWTALAGLLIILLSSCKTKTLIEYVPVEVEKTIKETETIRDTIIFHIPVPDEKKNTVQPSDTSKLENKYALSWAFWDGFFLHHYLGTKQDTIPIKAQTKDKVTTITVPIIVPVKGDTIVTNKLTWYQKLSVYWTIISLIIVIVFVVYKIKK